MIKKLAFYIYKIIFLFFNLFDSILKKKITYAFKDIITENSYESIFINNKKIFFFVPNLFTKYRLDNFFTKEPETLGWIQKFAKNSVFYDIGANIGNYSIYASVINPAIKKIYAFEPSFLNTRVLSRNISINNLSKKIIIIQLPLSNKKNLIQLMSETNFEEGGSFNSFGKNYNSGKITKKKNSYSILGTSLNDLVLNKVLPLPNYIKIDVDGIEDLILQGADKFLKNNVVRSILIELYPSSKNQFKNSFKTLKKCGFKLVQSSNNNYIFDKIN